jgi:ribonuclease J
VQQIAATAVEHGRQVAFLGRSMQQNVRLARSMGLLHIPDPAIVDIEEIDRFEPGKICVICTGSQGEPMSALALMAAHENHWVKLGPEDTVIISAHPIPGNESNVSRVIGGLHRAGADVVHSGLAPVHVSGHGAQEELKFLLNLIKPEYFVPVHGEYRHLVHHARLARSTGVAEERVLVCEDGDSLVLHQEGIDVEPRFAPAGYLYVDGIVGDVGRGVLRDRRVLAAEGIVVVIVTVDGQTGEVVTGPEIVTRGWVHAPEAESLLEEAKDAVVRSLAEAAEEGALDFETLRRHARKGLSRFINERTKRRPIVVPVVMEV